MKLSLSRIKIISYFDILYEVLINRKQCFIIYNDSYQSIKIYHISNPGIQSDMAKRKHYKFNNIEYK